MYCDEKVMKVYVGQNESHNIEGADYWLDCLHDIAVHITPGYRLVLETENYMISLGADGVDLTEKSNFRSYDDERLEECVHVIDFETGEGTKQAVFTDLETTLFVGERLLSVENNSAYFKLNFDDFVLKLIPYKLNESFKRVMKKNRWAYERVFGFERHLKSKCHFCGCEGEILIDPVSDYVVRCVECKQSTYAKIQIIHAIESWNKGEVQCDLDDIIIE